MSTRDRSRTKTLALAGGGALLLLLLLRPGKGWGGGKGSGTTDGARPRCQFRLAAAGLTLNGQPVDMGSAVATCKARGGTAEVSVTGDAVYGDYVALLEALKVAGIPTYHLPPVR